MCCLWIAQAFETEQKAWKEVSINLNRSLSESIALSVDHQSSSLHLRCGRALNAYEYAKEIAN
jgi:hypothetical protein